MADDQDLHDDADAAEEAFDQLRAEVAQLRAAMEALPGQLKICAPDYAPTLGAMAKALEKIESHPALRLTPQSYSSEVRASTEALRRNLETEVQRALNAIGQVSGAIGRFAGDLRAREAQRKAVIYAAAGGVVAGAAFWAAAAGPIARSLPASWRVPERMAAATLHADGWNEGSKLMQSTNPGGWAALWAADQLWRANARALAACTRSAGKAGKPQPCKVMVSPSQEPADGR